MQNYISAASIGEAWISSLKAISTCGTIRPDDKGPILELVPFFIEIHSPRLNDRLIDEYGNQEIIDFLGRNFQDTTPIADWGYSYAQRLYSINGKDQIQEVTNKLRLNQYSKSCAVTLLQPDHDIKHTPCLTTLDFKIRDDILLITASFRSQDIGNKMYGDALELLKIGMKMLNHLPANKVKLIHVISSAHIYCCDLKDIDQLLSNQNNRSFH